MKRARDLNSDDTRILGRPLFAAVALAALFAGSLLACSGDDGGRPGLGEACGEGCADGLTCISGQCSTAPDLGAALDLGPADASARADVGPDLGVFDLGSTSPDSGPVDTGVVASFCGSSGDRCATPDDCGRAIDPPLNCAFCPDEHTELCQSGSCLSPDRLELGDTTEVDFSAEGDDFTQLQSLVGVVVSQVTPSGGILGCDDVRRADFDLNDACLNVLTSRLITISQSGQSFRFTFGTFPSEQAVLLLVYGFDDRRSATEPKGVSCTPHVAGAPGSGPVLLVGGPME